MPRKIPMDSYVPESVKRDLLRVIGNLKAQGAKIRLIRIGYDDFKRTVDQMVKTSFGPFTPTLCGYPVEWGLHDTVDVIAVRPAAPVLATSIAGKQIELGKG